jgi:hypothetical protein
MVKWTMKKRRRSGYVRFDERQDVVASLELAAYSAKMIARRNDLYWKWLIIAAHSALQGALVCALSGTDGLGALAPSSRRAWLDWFEHRKGDPPKEKLADFKMLLKWGRDGRRMSTSGGQSLSLKAA